jgi:hypothetical protein
MKIKNFLFSLIIGLTASALAQPAPPGTVPPAVPVISVTASNHTTAANTNWSNGYHGNYGATNGSGGMTSGIYGNSYASYTNPYYTYARTNVAYTNPYYIYGQTNVAYANPAWSNINRELVATNDPNADDLNLPNNRPVKHWWKWW